MRRSGIPNLDFSTPGSYCNIGLMVIDMKKWRTMNIPRQAAYFAMNYRNRLWIVDQDLINCIANGQYQRLPPKWNLLEFYGSVYRRYWKLVAPYYSHDQMEEANHTPCIIHYCIFPKPWHKGAPSHDPAAFDTYFSRTEWSKIMQLPYRGGILNKMSASNRRIIAMAKVIYRELEMKRFPLFVYADMIKYALSHPLHVLMALKPIGLYGYWLIRSYTVPRAKPRNT
jgi:lipopolysaccharide biosynthesis glycosyltransferase